MTGETAVVESFRHEATVDEEAVPVVSLVIPPVDTVPKGAVTLFCLLMFVSKSEADRPVAQVHVIGELFPIRSIWNKTKN
jgi:hypothetical protein